MPPPIIIMSFNRPQFLAQVLASLVGQRDSNIERHEVHLFQDGAVNRYSRIRYARDAQIADCIAVFKRHFPLGSMHLSKENIGICENFRRAELYVFEKRRFDVAYFMEDDLVLSPVYIAMMNRLCRWAVRCSNVAYFAAYGDYYAAPEEIATRQRELATLDHHWGFGLCRRHWRTMQPLLQPYYDIVCGHDYSRRDSRAVFELYAALDAAPGVSSQDGVKAFACDRLGLWRANTVVPFARYIGSEGQHMTPEKFRTLGFERTVVAEEGIADLHLPDAAWIDKRLADQRAVFTRRRAVDYPSLLAKLPGGRYNPLRYCERDEVIFAHRLILNREPSSEQVIRSNVRSKSVAQLVAELVNSAEFRVFDAGNSERRPCSREDVVYAYRLFLHRDPETERAFDENVGVVERSELARAIWSGEECQTLWASIELPGRSAASSRYGANSHSKR